jgi:CRP-like cAMP-binding protein
MDTLATLTIMERIVFLRRVPLFAHIETADLKQIAQIASEHLFGDGDFIVRQGDIGNEMFIIMSGEVRVIIRTAKNIDKELARRQPGEVVGEMSIISQEPRSASLIAAGDVRTLTIEQKQFEGILRERPDTALAVLRVLCARLKES